jgi:hypothetical protein
VKFFSREIVRHAQVMQAQLHGNLQGEKAPLANVKILIILNIVT